MEDVKSDWSNSELSDSKNLLANDALPSAVKSDDEPIVTNLNNEEDANIDPDENDGVVRGFIGIN